MTLANAVGEGVSGIADRGAQGGRVDNDG